MISSSAKNYFEVRGRYGAAKPPPADRVGIGQVRLQYKKISALDAESPCKRAMRGEAFDYRVLARVDGVPE